MNIFNTILAIMISSIFLSNVAFAEEQKLKEKLSKGVITVKIQVKNCTSDAKKLCPGLKIGSKKSYMCLMAYEDNLSAKCKLGITEAALRLKKGMNAISYSIKACEADADKHCLSVQPGKGRIVGCLKKNETKLNKKCTVALKETGLWDIGAK